MNVEPFKIFAPAKINLRLVVLGRREDGYHLLSMLNAPITLFDELEVEITRDETLEIIVRESIEPELLSVLEDPDKNLAARAVARFRERFGLSFGARIHLTKRIPAGAGLGGGSSDAGCLLRALGNRFLKAREQQELNQVAVELGADVPYFLNPSFSWVQGIGDRVRSLPDKFLQGRSLLLICPNFGVSTVAVYADLRKREILPAALVDNQVQEFVARLESFPAQEDLHWGGLLHAVRNDLFASAVRQQPILGELLEELRRVPCVTAAMTGSGSALFALTDRSVPQDETLKLLEEQFAGRARLVKRLQFCARG